MYKALRDLIHKKGSCSLRKRMTGWYLTEDNELLGIGLVPFRRKPCLYILDDSNEHTVLATFSNEEAATRARLILDRVARGVVRGELN